MGRKESILIPFLIEALKQKKYGQDLDYVDELKNVFSMHLPHASKINDHLGCIKLLKDWDSLKNHTKVFNYTESNRRMKAALRRSDYLKLCKIHQYHFTYQILSSDEVKKKKEKKSGEEEKSLEKFREKEKNSLDDARPSSTESGYTSASPEPVNPLEEKDRNQSMEEPSSSNVMQPDVEESLDFIEMGISIYDIECLDHIEDFYDCVSDSAWNEVQQELFPSEIPELIYEFPEFKFYRFKYEGLLKKKTLMICEEKVITSMEEFNLLQIWEGFFVDPDLSRRLENHIVESGIIQDNHLLLFMYPRENLSLQETFVAS